MVEAEDYCSAQGRGPLLLKKRAGSSRVTGLGGPPDPWHRSSISSPNNEVHASVLRSRVEDQRPRILALERG